MHNHYVALHADTLFLLYYVHPEKKVPTWSKVDYHSSLQVAKLSSKQSHFETEEDSDHLAD